VQSAGGAAFDEAPPGALDRGGVDMKGFGSRRIGLVFVSREQDAGAGEGTGRGDALVEQTQEFSPLFMSEVDVVALEHGAALPQSSPIYNPPGRSSRSPVARD
jgi:hypothetical protein